jgi:hypothetical protein
VSHLVVAEVAKTFGIAAPPKLVASSATTVIDRAILTDIAAKNLGPRNAADAISGSSLAYFRHGRVAQRHGPRSVR